MAHYTQLMQSVAIVITAMDAIMSAERLSPAWYKTLRVKQYLDAQAKRVMEGEAV